MLRRELDHLVTAPYDIWQVVRVSSSPTQHGVRVEAAWLQETLEEMLRNHSYTVQSKCIDRKIYLRKKHAKAKY